MAKGFGGIPISWEHRAQPVAAFCLEARPQGLTSQEGLQANLVLTVFSLSNMAAVAKTLAHSELKRPLIGAFHGAFILALWLVCYFQNKDDSSLSSSWKLRSTCFSVWDLKGGRNSCLIVWKTVTVPLKAASRNNSKIVRRLFTLPSVFRMYLSFSIR